MKINPIHILSLGAGVQSSALAMMCSIGKIKPTPNCAIFADTQAEPKSVYDWLEYLKTKLSFNVHIVTKGNLEIDSSSIRINKTGKTYLRNQLPLHTVSKDGVNGMIRSRKCTYDYKIIPIEKKIKEIVGESLNHWRRIFKYEIAEFNKSKKDKRPCNYEAWKTMQDNCLVITMIGISIDESQRAKDSRIPWIRKQYPLIENGISRYNCLEFFDDIGLNRPPRSACVFCPFHSNSEWLRLKNHEALEFKRAIEFENKIRKLARSDQSLKSDLFLTNNGIPISEVDFESLERDRINKIKQRNDYNSAQLKFCFFEDEAFSNECEGMCGL